ncbi:MAG: hypothetical protein L6R45_21570 [Anaerolineae bacterium]|nr:hypothetical protein [Anaerolineae bacterium]
MVKYLSWNRVAGITLFQILILLGPVLLLALIIVAIFSGKAIIPLD